MLLLRLLWATVAFSGLLGALAHGAAAQSLLDRPPNVSGNWGGTSGTVYFHILHRFSVSSGPERKVTNVPTFLMALGLPARTLVGANYATNSQLAPRYPNEWEFFIRHAPFSQDQGAPVDLGGQVGYNLAADGVDGEVSLARRQGPVRIIVAARAMSDPFEAGHTVFALAGGATIRLHRYFALAGDLASLMDRRASEEMAWSAGLHIALPFTPHTLSLQAANTNAATLQGASRGEDEIRYGFEFTIPVNLRRWFGGGSPAPGSPPPLAPAPRPGEVTASGMRNFQFTPGRLEVAAGTTVEWKNTDPVAHTVTSAEGAFESGVINPGATWRHTFDTPGTYNYFCTPHPFMKGVVVVR